MIARLLPFICIGLLGALAPSLHADPEAYQIDPEASAITFKVRKHGVTWVDGSFKKFTGSGVLDPENPAQSQIEVIVEAASVDTANDKRDGALRGSEYFNTGEYPHLTFKSTGASRNEKGELEMEGEFTLLGVTKPIRLPVTIGPVETVNGRETRVGEAAFTIKRSDYGMTANPVMIGDEVQVQLRLVAFKKGPES